LPFFAGSVAAEPFLRDGLLPAHRADAPSLALTSPLEALTLETRASSEPEDLLTRLRSGFSLDYEDNRRIAAERNWFVRHPAYLERVFTRAQRYMPYILAEIERRDLPLELALLPIVESAYDPFAYSHGRAAGLWQMIPGTARRFGVRQNWWYDGRRDVVDSTRAALDYLEYLYELNDGDWLNAIASYNSGEGNVLRSAKRNRNAGKPHDFWNLKLPRETSTYVPKLLALVDIVADPDAYELALPTVADEPQFVVADIGSQLDLALAAELAGVDVDTVYSYNPGVRWKRHKVKNGEAISQIALEYNTTVAQIREANNLRGNMIRAGHYLLIPVATKPLSTYSQSADARLAKTQNRKRDGSKVEHVVRKGESFWTISRRYKVTHRQLAAWNGMAPGDPLPVGRKLVVWTDAVNESPQVSPATTLGNTTRKLRYTVRNGDSLYLIANRFRVSINDIARWNNIDKNKILRPGQKLTMYVDVTRQSS
jgi:membrane-bound lytic murein transglycosylase D